MNEAQPPDAPTAALTPMPTPMPARRRVLEAIPLCVAGLLGVFLGTYWVFDQAFGVGEAKLVFGLIVLPGMVWAVVLSEFVGYLLIHTKRSRRLAMSFFLSPVALLLAAIVIPGALLSPSRLVALADWMGRGHVTASRMAEAAALARTNGKPGLRLWDLHYRGLAIWPRFVTLVYDESGELGLPDSQRSNGFNQRLSEARRRLGSSVYPMEAETGAAVRWITRITPLREHFYYVEQIYGGKVPNTGG